MNQKVPFQPATYHTLIPYAMIDGAARAIDFYREIFGAVEKMRIPDENGKVLHAELQLGDSVLMLADACPAMPAPEPDKGAAHLMLYVPDVDEVTKRAVAAGATLLRPVETHFYGDRSGTLRDPYGYLWTVSTHVEDVSPEEMERRMAALKKPA